MHACHMENGRKRKKPEVPSGFISAGWKRVDVGDELLVGSEEGGFMELEELVPPTNSSSEVAASRSTKQEEDGTVATPIKTSKQKKQKADRKTRLESKRVMKTADVQPTAHVSMAPRAEQSAEDVEGLRAKLAALQQENKALKAGQSGQPGQPQKEKHIPADPNSARSRKLAAKRAKAKEVRAAKKATAKARKQRAAERAEQQTDEKVSTKKASREKAAGGTAALSGAPVSEPPCPAHHGASTAEATAARAGESPAWQSLGLGPGVVAAIAALGFEEPTPIQRECLLPAIRDRRDIIGAAQTGSGKTLAFGLPILQLLHSEAPGADAADARHAAAGRQSQQEGRTPLRALVLEPTRELAMQVCEHLQRVAKPLGVWVAPIVGGISPAKQTRLLGRQPQVVVATPGRLWELVRLGEPHLADLSRVGFLVLDEADRMAQQGHFQELSNILESLASQRADVGSQKDDDTAADDQDDYKSNEDDVEAGKAKPGAGLLQTFVFSATLTLPQKLRKRLRKGGGASGSMMLEDLMESIEFRGKPKVVDLTSQRKLADKVEEATLHCGDEERDELLYFLLAAHPGRTLVFANAVSTARRIAALLHILMLPSAALHAGMQQRARLKALDRFKANENAVLVASDVAARGLDITGVRCVIHYQIPASVDIYVHRSGRTARGSADGLAVALVAPKEAARYAALQQALDRPEPPAFPLNAALLPACRQRVKLAVRLDTVLREQSKAHAEKSWKQRNAEAMDVEVSSGGEDGSAPAAKKARQQGNDGSSLAHMQRELEELLAQPLQASFSRRFFTGVPSASVAAQGLPRPAQDAEPAMSDAPEETKQAAASAEDALVTESAKSQTLQQEAVKHTVALAQKAASSRQQPKGLKKGAGAGAKKAALKGAQKLSKKELEQAALKTALERRQRKRQRAPGVDVPALDRNASGPDALAVMRQARLAVLYYADTA